MTFDQAIMHAYEADLISEETAVLYSTRKGVVQRNIDQIKKQRGLHVEMSSGLRLDAPEEAANVIQRQPPKRGLFGI
jgi:hypothetical protein